VNFHFRSKDALFLETLKFMSSEYQENWTRAFDEAGPSAAEKLEAVMMVDFEPPISNRNRIAAWFAFYGEAKSRPTYMAACADRDQVIYEVMVELCRTIIEEGGYPNLDPEPIADGLGTMTEGLWLDLLIWPHNSSPEMAKQTLSAYLTALFPKHFPADERATD
jgi:TetR/AcrR family transcriptional repressor of bet genes